MCNNNLTAANIYQQLVLIMTSIGESFQGGRIPSTDKYLKTQNNSVRILLEMLFAA